MLADVAEESQGMIARAPVRPVVRLAGQGGDRMDGRPERENAVADR